MNAIVQNKSLKFMQSYSTFGINHMLLDILHDNSACTKPASSWKCLVLQTTQQ